MTEPVEDIDNDDALLRRIPDQPSMWTRKGGGVRPTSASLQPSDDDGGLSVDVRRLISDPAAPTSVLGEHPLHGLVEFAAGAVRQLDLEVEHAPLSGRYSHANVTGFPAGTAESLRVRRNLAKTAVWVQMPPGALDAA